jgi:hypothetical protein
MSTPEALIIAALTMFALAAVVWAVGPVLSGWPTHELNVLKTTEDWPPCSTDADLIVAAVNALPDLLDQLDSMEAELADYRAEDRRKRESAEMRRRGDVRCYRCGLRYAEREDYSCELSWGHMFDRAEMDRPMEGEE